MPAARTPPETQRSCRAVAYLSPAEMGEIRRLCASTGATVRDLLLRGSAAMKRDRDQEAQLIAEISGLCEQLGMPPIGDLRP